jgi:hypothetical protein
MHVLKRMPEYIGTCRYVSARFGFVICLAEVWRAVQNPCFAGALKISLIIGHSYEWSMRTPLIF